MNVKSRTKLFTICKNVSSMLFTVINPYGDGHANRIHLLTGISAYTICSRGRDFTSINLFNRPTLIAFHFQPALIKHA